MAYVSGGGGWGWTLSHLLCRSMNNLDGGGVALQAPDATAAFVEGRLRLRVSGHGPEAHVDPQSLHHLLDERGARVRKGLGHHADWEVKGQG